MMFLCKTIHTLLGYTSESDRNIPGHRRNIPSRESGGLRCVIEEGGPRVTSSPDRGGDPGSWGLREAAGPTCTESLGSESCDVADVASAEEISAVRSSRSSKRCRRSARVNRKFPPPLPWLTEADGRRSCFMKAERRDGRFLLKEVRIERPEVMRASRQNGRLRLHLVEIEDGVEEVDVAEVEEREEATPSPRMMTAMRCQEAVSGNGNMPTWWNHRFVTTA